MKCQSCGKCIAISEKESVCDINCADKGNFKLHRDYFDTFQCDEYNERTAPPKPPKENVLIVLSGSGRDFAIYDEDITSSKVLGEAVTLAYDEGCEYIKLGELRFKLADIACYGYIGD